jgi:signal transduction histidine kinase
VTIIVEIFREIDNEKYLKVSVKDTGVGIPDEDQDKLFKLFGFVQST